MILCNCVIVVVWTAKNHGQQLWKISFTLAAEGERSKDVDLQPALMGRSGLMLLEGMTVLFVAWCQVHIVMHCQGDGNRHGKWITDKRSLVVAGAIHHWMMDMLDELRIKNGSSEQPEMGSSKHEQFLMKGLNIYNSMTREQTSLLLKTV